MRREAMEAASEAVDVFAKSVEEIGPEMCFQCSVGTNAPGDPILAFWGSGGTMDLSNFEDLVSMVLLRMAQLNKWDKDDVAAELTRMLLKVYALAFNTEGDGMSAETRMSLHKECIEKMDAVARYLGLKE